MGTVYQSNLEIISYYCCKLCCVSFCVNKDNINCVLISNMFVQFLKVALINLLFPLKVINVPFVMQK